jgi:hypothetical protein
MEKTVTDKITIDVGKVAKRAREISLEAAKTMPGLAVGPEIAFIGFTLDYLAVREALREIEPNAIDQIFDKIKTKIEDDMKKD